VRCDAWPAERKCVSRGWCGMRPVNATRCIAWAAKRLSALLSCLLPATERARRTIKLIRHLLLPAPGRGRSRRFAVDNAPSASWQLARRLNPTGTANVRNFGTTPFRASDFRDHPTVPHHGAVGHGGLSRGACGSDPQKTQGGPIIPEMQRAAGHQVVDALNTRGMAIAAGPTRRGQPVSRSRVIFTSACSGMPQSLVKRGCWCGREDSNLHGLPR
jgi:hypothetical protein